MLHHSRHVLRAEDAHEIHVQTWRPDGECTRVAPEFEVTTPESISPEAGSPANLVDFVNPPIGDVPLEIPEGDIERLIELFQFPVPEGNRLAQDRLVAIGAPAVPALIEALGSWDNKTWKQAQKDLGRIGAPAHDALLGRAPAPPVLQRLKAWVEQA